MLLLLYKNKLFAQKICIYIKKVVLLCDFFIIGDKDAVMLQ